MNEQKYLTELTIDGVTYTLTPKAPPTPEPMYPNAKRWERVKGRTYWCVNPNGDIDDCQEEGEEYDNECYQNGNYYRSEREAEHARDTQVLMNQIQRWRDENDPVVVSWADSDKAKYFIDYNYSVKDLSINWACGYRTLSVTYFSSGELAEQCLNATEADYTQTYGERLKALFEVE